MAGFLNEIKACNFTKIILCPLEVFSSELNEIFRTATLQNTCERPLLYFAKCMETYMTLHDISLIKYTTKTMFIFVNKLLFHTGNIVKLQ